MERSNYILSVFLLLTALPVALQANEVESDPVPLSLNVEVTSHFVVKANEKVARIDEKFRISCDASVTNWVKSTCGPDKPVGLRLLDDISTGSCGISFYAFSCLRVKN